MAARQMPQNLEAEMSVLGVAFINQYSIEKISEELTSDMFFDEKNRYIFEAIIELHKNRIPVDVTTIKDYGISNCPQLSNIYYLSNKIVKVEESVAQAHKRITEHINDLTKHTGGHHHE